MRILIVRLGSLGDVALAAPVVRRLRAAYPTATIDFITKPPYLPILETFEGLNSRIAEGVARLAEPEYDAVLDLQNNLRSRLMLGSIKSRRILRYWRPRWNRTMRIHLPRLRSRIATPPHVVIQYLQAAAPLGAFDDGLPTRLKATPEMLEAGAKLLQGSGDGRLVVAAPGGRHGTKIWPQEYWVELLNQLGSRSYGRQVLVGSKEDAPIGEAISAAVSHKIVNLAGRTTIGELAGLLAHADLAVSGDTGPMHIAAGLGTATAAIFGPTVEEFGFAPFRANSRVVQVEVLECRPCHPHGGASCPLKHFLCMRELTPQAVLDAIAGLEEKRQ